MKAVSLINNLSCLTIHNVCDYADSYKNKTWQPYTVETAAAYAKEVLSVIPPVDVVNTHTAEEAIRDTSS